MKYAIKAEEEAEEGITVQNEDDILRSDDNDEEETHLNINKETSQEALKQKLQEKANHVQDKSKAFDIGNDAADENNQNDTQAEAENKNENPNIEINLQESQ